VSQAAPGPDAQTLQPRKYLPVLGIMLKLALGVIGSVLSGSLFAGDGDWLIHLDGTSRHFHRRDLNEQNWGAGFTYEFNPTDRYVWSAEGDYFRDSLHDPSAYVGGAYRRRFRYLDIGVLAFIMYRESAKKTIGSSVFPGALPFLEFGTRRIRFRTTYIPRVTGRDDEAVTLQLLLRL
jgi:Antimicrobial peptide resistance and lipid A acylation protein PagP